MNSSILSRPSSLSWAVCTLALQAGAQAQPAPNLPARTPVAVQTESATPATLSTVVITQQRAKGFSSNVVGIGAFRDQLPIDVPLTNSVITRDALDAQGARSVLDAVRNTAGVTRSQLGSSYYDNLAVRGVAMENRSSYRLDGSLPLIALIPIPMENKERVEVLKGASSMYFGMVPPAGIVSFEMKRAGAKPVTSVAASVNEHGGYDVALDVGRRFGDSSQFGLRVNALDGKEELGLNNYKGKRGLLSAAVDARLLDNLTVRGAFEHYTKTASEQASVQLIGAATVLPQVPDNKTNLAGEWAQTVGESNNALVRVDWGFSDNWSLSAEYGTARSTRDRLFTQFAFNDISGYTTGVGRVFGNFNSGAYYNNQNARVDVSGRLETGPVAHEVTVGWTRNTRTQDTRGTSVQSWGCAALSATCTLTSARNVRQNLYAPIMVPLQVQAAPNGPQATSIVDVGVYALNRILISPQWHVMVGVRRNDYTSRQTDPVLLDAVTRLPVAAYNANKTTPNFSVIYKPMPNMSVYASALKGLEAGALVGNTFANSGSLLPSALTTQKELGAKMQLAGGLLLQAAYFDIERAQTTSEPAPAGSIAPPGLPGTAPSTWRIQTQNGQARYKGLELSASGDISSRFGIVASAILMDPKITRDSTLGASNTQGNVPGNTAKRTLSLFGEYRLAAVEGLAFNAGVYYVGERPVSNLNRVSLPAAATLSLGARFRTQVLGNAAVFQLNIDNATDKSYWSSADAASANPLVAYGLPRLARLSAKFDF